MGDLNRNRKYLLSGLPRTSVLVPCLRYTVMAVWSRECSVVSKSFVTPRTVAHQAPLSMEFSRSGILEWVAIFTSRGSPQLTHGSNSCSWVSCTGRQILYHCTTWYTDLVLKPPHTRNKKAFIKICYPNFTRGFPGGSDNKESTCNMGDLHSFPGLGQSPGGGHGNPLQDSCLEDPHGQRSLASPSPWGHRKSDTTERLSTAKFY